MLKIEAWRPKELVCSDCRDTGIVIPRDGQMPIEVGRFSSECEEGKRRWEEIGKTLELVKG